MALVTSAFISYASAVLLSYTQWNAAALSDAHNAGIVDEDVHTRELII